VGLDALLERRTVGHAGRSMNGTGSRRPERLAGWVITAEAAAAISDGGLAVEMAADQDPQALLQGAVGAFAAAARLG